MAVRVATQATAPARLSRQLRLTVVTLTAVGLIGTWIDFTALGFSGGGCGGGGAVLFFIDVIVGALLLGLAAFTAGALVLLWFQPIAGPPIVIACNLLAMGFYGWWVPIEAGQAALGFSLALLAVAPVIAVLVLLRPLLTPGAVWVKVIKVGALGLLAVPVLFVYVQGISGELAKAAAPAPPSVTVGTCSRGGA